MCISAFDLEEDSIKRKKKHETFRASEFLEIQGVQEGTVGVQSDAWFGVVMTVFWSP